MGFVWQYFDFAGEVERRMDVWRSAFGVRGSAFGGAVRTSVTLLGQDIGNTVTVLVHGLILSSAN